MSGSTANLNININANAGNTPATMQSISAAIAQLNSQLQTAGVSAQRFSASLQQGANGLTLTSVSASQAANNMHQFGGATSGAMRELIVIGHEAMSGRFSRIPGSLLVMTEYMGGLSLATMGLVGSLALAGVGAAHLFEWFNRIKEAKAGAEAAAAGFNPQFDPKALDAQVDALRQATGVTTEDAGKIVQAYAGMRGATIQQLQGMEDVTANYAKATGTSLEAAAKAIRNVMEAPSQRGREFISTFADSAGTLAAFDRITGDTAPMQKRMVIMQELLDLNTRVSQAPSIKQDPIMPDMSGMSSAMVAARAGRQQVYAQEEADQAAHFAKLQADAKAAMANMSNEETPQGGQAQTWFEKQQLGADELKNKIISTATNYKTAMEQADTALAKYWKDVSEHAVAGSKEQIQAKEEYLRYEDAASVQQLHVTQQTADAGFKAQLASYDAQIAAAGHNKDEVLALEQAKVNLFIQYNKTGTAAYEEELKRQAELVQRYKDQETQAAEKAVSEQIAADNKNYTNQKTIMDAEVRTNALSKQAELEQLTQLNQEEESAELQAVNSLISSLSAGTAAYQAAMDQRAKIIMDFNSRQAAINAQSITDADKTASGTEKVFDNAFNSIGSEGESTFQKLISRQESFARAGLNMAGAVISAFANMCAQMVARWVAMELANTATTATQNAVRTAQENGNSGLTVLISKTLTSWLGLETTKTAIVTQGAATQNAVVAASNTSQVATTTTSQAAQTAAVTAGGAARVASTAVAASTSRATQAAINGPSVMADAAKAFSGTYASVASIPVVGWLLAPPAAAAAFAAVAAYEGLASFATGAYNLPEDMIAQVHKGEMIVPAAQAAQLRTSMDSGYNIAAFAPNINVPRPLESFNNVHSQGGNISFVQNLAIHGAPGSSLGGAATQLMARAKRDAESMFWQQARNGALKPRNI